MWVHTAARLEIPVHPVNRHSPMLPNEKADSFKSELVSVNIVGDACLGQADESLAEKTRTLARDVGVRLLRARFTGPEEGSLFVDADYWVDLSNPEISDAIFRYLRDRV